MKEIFGDAIRLAYRYDNLCITTNGTIKNNGQGVMGAGIAKTIATYYPAAPKYLGAHLKAYGNHVQHLFTTTTHPTKILSFPVKHNWYDTADIDLIIRSCQELTTYLDAHPKEIALLPRPGCGNGKLNWSEVKPIIEPLLDNRITIVHWEEE